VKYFEKNLLLDKGCLWSVQPIIRIAEFTKAFLMQNDFEVITDVRLDSLTKKVFQVR
jgi:hypothetical protein